MLSDVLRAPAKKIGAMKIFRTAKFAVAFGAFLVMQGAVSSAFAETPAALGADSKNPASRFDGIWQKAVPTLRYSANPPFTPAAKAKFLALKPQDDPGARCMEPGIGRMMLSPGPWEAVALNNHLLIVAEGFHAVRRIWTDRSEHDKDADPGFYGDNFVKWDGDTMVVDTVSLNGLNYLDNWGYPMSDQMHIIERWHMANPNRLEIQYTFDDPKNYTKPWTVTIPYARHSDFRLGEYSCTENNRNNPDDPSTPKVWTSTDKPSAYVERPPQAGR